MPTIIPVACEQCDTGYDLTLDLNTGSISIGEKVNADDACHRCGGKLTAPSGRYIREQDTGRLIRVGDCDESP